MQPPKPCVSANVTLLAAVLGSLQHVSRVFFSPAIITLSENSSEHGKMVFLNNIDSTSVWSQQKLREEGNSSKAFEMGQKSFINILLIRNIRLQTAFSKATLLANTSPREIEAHVSPLRNPTL